MEGLLRHLADRVTWDILHTKQPGDRLTTEEAIFYAHDSMVMGDIDFGDLTESMRLVVMYNATQGGISMGVFCGLTNLALRELDQLAARHGASTAEWWAKTKRRNTHLTKENGQRMIGTAGELGIAIDFGGPEVQLANKLEAQFRAFEGARTRWLNGAQTLRPRTSRG